MNGRTHPGADNRVLVPWRAVGAIALAAAAGGLAGCGKYGPPVEPAAAPWESAPAANERTERVDAGPGSDARDPRRERGAREADEEYDW